MLNPAKKLLCRQKLSSVPSKSQGNMSPIDGHHSGKAMKAEEIAISLANTSLSNRHQSRQKP